MTQLQCSRCGQRIKRAAAMSGEYAFGPVCGRKLGLITDSPKPKRLTSLFTRVRKSAVRRLEELQMSLELEIPCA